MLFIRGARQLVTLRGSAPRRGRDMADLGVIRDGALLIDGDLIDEVGSTRRIENLRKARGARVIEASGKVVLPGFVDSCTRLIFTAPALEGLDERMEGAARTAGWDDNEAAAIRSLSPTALRLRARRWTYLSASHGTTTLEVRLGRALSPAVELRALRAARLLAGDPIEVETAFTASAPSPLAGDEGGAGLLERAEHLLPEIARRRLAYACELAADAEGLTPSAARGIAALARRCGLALKVVAERTPGDGGARLAVEANAVAADHLQYLQESGIDLLARSPTVATLLPALHEGGAAALAPARGLIDCGAAVALATGFGPSGSPTLNMPLTMGFGCRLLRMQPEETIAAATLNGAAAMGLAGRLGSLEPGKQADLSIFDVSDYREIPYYVGMNLCLMTIKKGRIVYRAAKLPALPASGAGSSARKTSQ